MGKHLESPHIVSETCIQAECFRLYRFISEWFQIDHEEMLMKSVKKKWMVMWRGLKIYSFWGQISVKKSGIVLNFLWRHLYVSLTIEVKTMHTSVLYWTKYLIQQHVSCEHLQIFLHKCSKMYLTRCQKAMWVISQKYESDEIIFESLEDDRCFYLSGLIYLVLEYFWSEII